MRVTTTTAVVTWAAAPVVRSALRAADVLDRPTHRSSHSLPVPRGGGVACALGVLAGGILARREGGGLTGRQALAVGVLTTTGLADDIHGLPAAVRLAVQVAAGWGAGRGGADVTGALAFPVIVNVVNFMDGINGITGLTALAWGVTGAGGGAPTVAALVAGAAAGFLPWNLPGGQLFLGDSGSYLFGSLIGSGVLSTSSAREAQRLLVPLLPYLADAGLTLCRRHLHGEPLLVAHREHAYQRLVHEAGLSHAQVAAGHAVVVAGLGLVAQRCSAPVATATGVVVALAWACAPVIVKRIRRDPRRSRQQLAH